MPRRAKRETEPVAEKPTSPKKTNTKPMLIVFLILHGLLITAAYCKSLKAG